MPWPNSTKWIFDELLAQPGLEQPRQEVPHIPAIKTNFRDAVMPEQSAQMVGDMLIRDSPTGRRLQIALCPPEIVRKLIDCRLLD